MIQCFLLLVVLIIKDKDSFLAERFSSILEDSSYFIRLLLSRCEYDLGGIIEEYDDMFENSFKTEVSSKYQDDMAIILIHLLGSS